MHMTLARTSIYRMHAHMMSIISGAHDKLYIRPKSGSLMLLFLEIYAVHLQGADTSFVTCNAPSLSHNAICRDVPYLCGREESARLSM